MIVSFSRFSQESKVSVSIPKSSIAGQSLISPSGQTQSSILRVAPVRYRTFDVSQDTIEIKFGKKQSAPAVAVGRGVLQSSQRPKHPLSMRLGMGLMGLSMLGMFFLPSHHSQSTSNEKPKEITMSSHDGHTETLHVSQILLDPNMLVGIVGMLFMAEGMYGKRRPSRYLIEEVANRHLSLQLSNPNDRVIQKDGKEMNLTQPERNSLQAWLDKVYDTIYGEHSPAKRMGIRVKAVGETEKRIIEELDLIEQYKKAMIQAPYWSSDSDLQLPLSTKERANMDRFCKIASYQPLCRLLEINDDQDKENLARSLGVKEAIKEIEEQSGKNLNTVQNFMDSHGDEIRYKLTPCHSPYLTRLKSDAEDSDLPEFVIFTTNPDINAKAFQRLAQQAVNILAKLHLKPEAENIAQTSIQP